MLLLVDLEVRILNSMYRLTLWCANPCSIPFLSGRFLFVKNFCLGLIRPEVSFYKCLGYFLYW